MTMTILVVETPTTEKRRQVDEKTRETPTTD